MLVLFKLTNLLLSKSYEETSGKLTFGQGETTLSWGKMDLGRNDRNSVGICKIFSVLIT